MWKSVMEPGVSADDQKTAKKAAKLYKVYPMGYVGLDDARSFCKVFGGETGCTAALPTEAQWEYACRAGTIGPFAGTGDPAEMGWSVEQTGNGDEVNPIGVHRVKTRKPNAWGLYDMHGNLSEWVADRYGEYDRRPQVDPKGPDEGESGICRGGSVLSDPNQCRSACRISRAAVTRRALGGEFPPRTAAGLGGPEEAEPLPGAFRVRRRFLSRKRPPESL